MAVEKKTLTDVYKRQVKDEMRFESIFRMLIRLGLAEWFVANNEMCIRDRDCCA